jgi:dTDP-4-dehydrorhamnose reductase
VASLVRTLIIGATGLVGQALMAHYRANSDPTHQIVGVSSADGDIRDPKAVDDLIERHRPDWTVIAAALSDVDACEREPEQAHAVNTLGPSYIARACRQFGGRLLSLSTDYVFDGKKVVPYEPEDAVNPLNVYGRSKAAGEEAVRKELPHACIVRTSWVFGLGRPTLPAAILDQAEHKSEVLVVSEQTSAPTYAPDLAETLDSLMQANAQGTLHACGANGCTRLEWAREILRVVGKATFPLRAVTLPQLNRTAPRPHYTVLSTACLAQFGIRARPWQETLLDYLAARRNMEAKGDASGTK